jgi:hypothetical protein
VFKHHVQCDLDKAISLGISIVREAQARYHYAWEQSIDSDRRYEIERSIFWPYKSKSSMLFWKYVVGGDAWLRHRTAEWFCTCTISSFIHHGQHTLKYKIMYDFSKFTEEGTHTGLSPPPPPLPPPPPPPPGLPTPVPI